MEKSKVLIVDDDQDLLHVMAEILSDNHEIATASNAREFHELVGDYATEKGFMPDLIIFDVNLPDTNGDVLAYQLKKIVGKKSIPILLVSSADELEKKAALSGADGFLTKPFDIYDLIETVQRFTR